MQFQIAATALRTPARKSVMARAEPINANVRKDEAKVVDTIKAVEEKAKKVGSGLGRHFLYRNDDAWAALRVATADFLRARTVIDVVYINNNRFRINYDIAVGLLSMSGGGHMSCFDSC